MFSVMKMGMCFLPSCTAMVCPIISGTIVEARDQHLMIRFSLAAFSRSMLRISFGCTYGPFFTERALALPFTRTPKGARMADTPRCGCRPLGAGYLPTSPSASG